MICFIKNFIKVLSLFIVAFAVMAGSVLLASWLSMEAFGTEDYAPVVWLVIGTMIVAGVVAKDLGCD